ncbi:hypothetical protein ACFFQW_16515 [Umezawaea endophytica]|uniref:Uncharacterized protein n=1 Tax=Umezawaea endophytica TaxID=1654476 RepID=A0A9X2VQ98_9PSEU|nr:hypothetical protein [Umezawaea endophytica]MCS7480354.1 hypothetical protein [Umezawaea endophytica]
MAISVIVEEDGLTVRNIGGGTAVATEERPGTAALHVDCDDFRQFLSDAKTGKFDDLV